MMVQSFMPLNLAWLLCYSALLVHTKRRSTTFEDRICKYARNYGCDVRSPGLSSQFYETGAKQLTKLQDFTLKINEELKNITGINSDDTSVGVITSRQLSKLLTGIQIKDYGYGFKTLIFNKRMRSRRDAINRVLKTSRNYDNEIRTDDVRRLGDYDDKGVYDLCIKNLFLNNITKLRQNSPEYVASISVLSPPFITDLTKVIDENINHPGLHLTGNYSYHNVVQHFIELLDRNSFPFADHYIERGRTPLIRLFAERANELYYIILDT